MTNIEQSVRAPSASELLSAKAVRDRCHQVLAAAPELQCFRVHPDRLDGVADYVIDTIRQNYPDLKVPFHARWRHFNFAGVDRWREMAHSLDIDRDEMARIQLDLVVTSVLLDAGAGPNWRYFDPCTSTSYARSEGLALASLDSFQAGLFSSSADNKLIADAAGLQAVTRERLAAAFQVTQDNPLDGLDGRAALMRALGDALSAKPEFFSSETPRIGGLYDWIKRTHSGSAHAASAQASDLLKMILSAFGSIWPGRLDVGGVNLGDTWQHPAVTCAGETDGLVPFHKLSQWLTYSLIEPLEDAGIRITGIDDLTGLAEYRNGGLLVDLGVLEVRDAGALNEAHAPGDPLIVEWRALTVALLDLLAGAVRHKLDLDAQALPLASVLEGGTWAAGRRVASQLRAHGGPPIRIISDGSVF